MYTASRGGHAPGHLRDAFIEWLCSSERGDTTEVGGERRPLRWLIGQLWNCSDVMPSEYCEELELPQGSTYAQAVRSISKGA